MMGWADTADVEEALPGITPDPDWLQSCTDAANAWAFRRRLSAGYADDPDLTPGADVTLGVVLWAVSLYKQRGSVDGFDSFNQLEGFIPTGSLGEVNKLLGIPRPVGVF